MFNFFTKKKVNIENIYTKETYEALKNLKAHDISNIVSLIQNLDYKTTTDLLETLEKSNQIEEAKQILHIAQTKFGGDQFLSYLGGKILSHNNVFLNGNDGNPLLKSKL